MNSKRLNGVRWVRRHYMKQRGRHSLDEAEELRIKGEL